MRISMLALSLALLLAACEGQAPQPGSPAVQPAPGSGTPLPAGYPAPAAAPAAPAGYPAPASQAQPQGANNAPAGYPPPPTELAIPEGPAFAIDQPIKASQTTITGSGPANVPIRLVNVTRSAEEIGRTVIGADGKFSLAVSNLPAGERVGIMIGDLAGTGFDRINFLSGPGYEDIPQMGIFFAQASIEP